MKKFILPLRFVFLGLLLLPSMGLADVYMYRDQNGVINFTNVPTHGGYRRVMREGDRLRQGCPFRVTTTRLFDPLLIGTVSMPIWSAP